MYPVYMNTLPTFFYAMPIFMMLMLVDLMLKGYALWRSSRNNQPYWFVALLLVNSMGILPAIYLAFFNHTKIVRETVSRKPRKVNQKKG